MSDEVRQLMLQLQGECDYAADLQVLADFLEPAQEVRLGRNEALIMPGQYDPNVYVVQQGVMRQAYFSGEREVTRAFCMPPTVIIEMHCFYGHTGAFYQVEACCKSRLLKVSKSHFDHMIATSPEFSRWMNHIFAGQIFFYDHKNSVINGDAESQLRALVQARPEIMQLVPLKHIASYLGITQSYLSRLKRRIHAEGQ